MPADVITVLAPQTALESRGPQRASAVVLRATRRLFANDAILDSGERPAVSTARADRCDTESAR